MSLSRKNGGKKEYSQVPLKDKKGLAVSLLRPGTSLVVRVCKNGVWDMSETNLLPVVFQDEFTLLTNSQGTGISINTFCFLVSVTSVASLVFPLFGGNYRIWLFSP